jgi:multimeric flavodoxin WrbA|uniref:Flavodoxin family protein n=1 Tax=Desulfomonile tiedjei TaxID=2358 RepID=A0A7C4AS36_9BACT
MNILGIFGSPRKGGNSDILLQEALESAENAGAKVSTLRCCDLNIQGCIECGGCDQTGVCVVEDDMSLVYPKLLDSDVIILASPIFFYSIPSQAKALIDRCQAMYCRRRLEKESGVPGAGDYKGGGYLICVGATKGKNLFDGVQLVARYFYDALGKAYKGGIQFRSVEGKGEVSQHPEYLQEARELGLRIVREGP